MTKDITEAEALMLLSKLKDMNELEKIDTLEKVWNVRFESGILNDVFEEIVNKIDQDRTKKTQK